MTNLQQQFRDAMARVPAPVVVVTTIVDDVPQGTTVSAFASLSVAPPMVMLALDHRGAMKDHLALSGRMGINILAADQAELATRFASPVDRFAGLRWWSDEGVPRLADAAAFLRCDELEFRPGGDHEIILGTVAAAEPLREASLAHHLRRFHPVPAAD